MNMVKKDYILTGDIGGTNPSFGIVEVPGYKILKIERKNKPDKKELFDFLVNFLQDSRKELKIKIDDACFSIAGPIENRKDTQYVDITNVGYALDSKKMMEICALKSCLFINDFQAISSGVNILDKKDFSILNKGSEEEFANKAAIGAGTGLGKSMLAYDKVRKIYVPLSSEGGHADFPIANRREFEIVEYMIRKKRVKGISYEDLVSGRGIESIYSYLQMTEYPRQPANLNAEAISLSKEKNPCSKKTFQMFIRFYAKAARNYALETLSKGGIYIAGGIASKNLDAFDSFMEEFTKHDTYEELLKKIPVKIITDYDISHKGAAFAFINR